jgi:fructokinase
VFLSGPGIAADYARRGGERCRSEEIVARAERGEALALTALEVWERRLARGLATIINVLDPDVIVVGGCLSRLERLYKNVPAHWGAWVFSDQVVTKLVPAKHGDASGVRGAARLW